MSLITFHPDFLVAALLGATILLSASLGQASAIPGETSSVTIGETQLQVLNKTVMIAAPRGYCIDRLASLADSRVAFVLMASCRSITGDFHASTPSRPGLLTASVDGSGDAVPTHRDLADFFASHNGRAALSRSGNAEAMELGAVFTRDGVLYLHASEAVGGGTMAGHSWRAVFEINGRMVTATLRDLADHPIPADEGFRTVEQFVERLVAANPPELRP